MKQQLDVLEMAMITTTGDKKNLVSLFGDHHIDHVDHHMLIKLIIILMLIIDDGV